MRAKKMYNKSRKRIGRGPGSGHGKTSTRGHKGQKARSGVSFRSGFEGGQNPLYRRIPKRGFNQASFQRKLSPVNLDRLEALGEKEITPETLIRHGLLKKSDFGVKILGNGDVKSALSVKAHGFSASAIEKIKKAGGETFVIEFVKPAKSQKDQKK